MPKKRAERDGTPASKTPSGFGWRGSRAVPSRRRGPRKGATGGHSVHGQEAKVPARHYSCCRSTATPYSASSSTCLVEELNG